MDEQTETKKHRSWKRWLKPAAGLLLLASIAGNVWLYNMYQQAQDDNPSNQARQIVEELRQTTALPDEDPSVLTVVDKNKLTNPELARSAENGDKILLFQKSAKAVIYRPSSKKLITILNIQPAAATPGVKKQP